MPGLGRRSSESRSTVAAGERRGRPPRAGPAPPPRTRSRAGVWPPRCPPGRDRRRRLRECGITPLYSQGSVSSIAFTDDHRRTIVNRRLTMQKRPSRQPRPAYCPPESGRLPRVTLADPAADARLAAFAKAIGHPTRVRILRLLAGRDARMCCQFVDKLPLAQSTVSEHLHTPAAGLLRTHADGPRAGYCVVPSALRQLKQLLRDLYQGRV